jgi:hypothetical protein
MKNLQKLIYRILRADEGNSTVIMDRIDYEAKVPNMLNDGPYTALLKDPTPTIAKKVKEFCCYLQSQNKLDTNKSKYISNNNQRCPTFYGRSSDVYGRSEANVPLRPIVYFRRSPTYKLASYLVPVLKSLCEDHPFNTKTSFVFAEEIKSLTIRRTESLVSFDALSLFTKVPIEDTLLIIQRRLQTSNAWEKFTNLSIQDIMSGLEICVKNANFFSQNEGSAICYAPVFCEIFLQELEENIVSTDQNIRFYRRYVDDIFAIVKSRFIPHVLKQLNSFHHNVQFTVEEENDGTIAFLDVLIIRTEEGRLIKFIGNPLIQKNMSTSIHVITFLR